MKKNLKIKGKKIHSWMWVSLFFGSIFFPFSSAVSGDEVEFLSTSITQEEVTDSSVEPVEKTEISETENDADSLGTVSRFKAKSGSGSSYKNAMRSDTTRADSGSGYILQLVSGLLVVLVSIIVLAWIAKRFNRMQSLGGGNLRIIEGISMGARERVVVVEVDGSRLLLGVSPGRINMLHILGDASEDQENNTNPTGEKNKEDDEVTFSQRIAAAMIREKP